MAANSTPQAPAFHQFLVGLVPVHFILDVFQMPLAPNMLFLLERLSLLMCLIAELAFSLSTKIPWTFGTFPIFSQGLDSTGSENIAWHIFSIYSSLSPYPDNLGRLEGPRTLNFL